MERSHGTTIVSVRRHGKVVIGGDGQVTLGNTVMKGNARKVRRLYHGQSDRRICRRHCRCLHPVRTIRSRNWRNIRAI